LDKALRADKISLDQEIGKIGDHVRGVGGLLFENKDFTKLINEIETRTENILELNPDIERKLTFELSGLNNVFFFGPKSSTIETCLFFSDFIIGSRIKGG